MPVKKLKEFLDKNKVKYIAISHSPAFTAQEIAASAHVRGKEVAKTVIVKVDGDVAMAVLPAPQHVDFDLLKEALGAESTELASEEEFADRFPGCELGAMPPLGNLYDMKVYADASLQEDEEIIFNAGTHSELIRLSWKDFQKLVKPRLLRFAQGVEV